MTSDSPPIPTTPDLMSLPLDPRHAQHPMGSMADGGRSTLRYKPAYELTDEKLERAGRTSTSKPRPT